MKKGITWFLIVLCAFILYVVILASMNSSAVRDALPGSDRIPPSDAVRQAETSRQGYIPARDTVKPKTIPAWRGGVKSDSADAKVDMKELDNIDKIVSRGREK